MSVLLTRTAEENARFALRLDAEGISHLSWPLSKIEREDAQVGVPQDAQALIFTSANGVRAFAALCPERDLPALCVGRRTSEVAQEQGFTGAQYAAGSATDLLAVLPHQPFRTLFYPRAQEVSTDLRAKLGPEFKVVEQVVYKALPAGPPESKVADALAEGRIALITIWSRRNAQVLGEYLTNSSHIALETIKLAVISENAAEPLAKAGFGGVFIAPTPDASGMLDAIFAALRQDFEPR